MPPPFIASSRSAAGGTREMMGFWDYPDSPQRTPLNVKVTGVVDRPRYRIEKLYYESLPKLYVDANLYVPKDLKGKAPGILYTCGHNQDQKGDYQAHGRRFAELGFVCLLIETIQRGESKGYHHGPYEEGWFHWYSRGYTVAGIEMYNGIRGLICWSSARTWTRRTLGPRDCQEEVPTVGGSPPVTSA